MASVDAAGDPLRSFASATSLLFRTLGPAAASTSPSRAPGALLGGSLKRSKELMEQASLVLRERGDIQNLYQEDRADGKNNQQGRRPGLDRKRAQFSLKPTQSNPVNVDFSKALSIDDPEEYFLTLERLEKADREIKKLRGEVPTKTANYDRPMEPPKKRPGMSRRKSVYSYNFSVGTDASDGTEAPDSQMGTLPESQSTQDDMPPSVPERTKPPVPSSSSQCDIQDVSTREDSFAKKDKGATLDSLMSAFKNLDESKEESLLREKLQIKEINIGEACIPDLFNVPGDRPVRSTKQKYLRSDRTPERPVLGSHHAPISKWEKHILGRDILDDKADLSEDDESDNSPETVVDKQSQVHSSYNDVVLTNDSDVAKKKDASSGQNGSLEEEHMPVNHPFTERPNNEPGTSSHHLEGETTKVLGSAPGRNVSVLHGEDENIGYQGVLGGDMLVQDEPIHPPEIPPDAHNQSHIQDENVEKQAVDISRELPLSKGGKQNAVQKRKNKKQSAKRGKRVSDKPIHTSEILPEDIVPQNNSHVHEGNFEKPAVGASNELSPSKDSKQKRVQNEESKKQPLKRMKRGAEEASNPLGIPPENCDTETQPSMQDTNIEQTVDTRVPRSPNKGKLQKEGQRRKKRQEVNRRKSLTAFGLAWQSGVRRSTRIRSRPLQDWLGERLLYGRIHDTMATVIGVKSYSPSQDGKVELRVKSFVPEQYSDMVAQAAKY
ncbi:unnamed protein product [Triticum turgidum subsp. durum]|uniref:Centromere protein C n=1 Tax=Triticum turgidum subsp. durum TaxID=4567 RepID=A0A9R0RJY8_TRITD|nr:unnamed protein product [Triticum turgidum subsp. durum]